MRYRRRLEFVDAVRFTDPDNPPDCVERGRDGIFRMQTGSITGTVIKPGQWIVVEESGTMIRLSDPIFHGIYELAENGT